MHTVQFVRRIQGMRAIYWNQRKYDIQIEKTNWLFGRLVSVSRPPQGNRNSLYAVLFIARAKPVGPPSNYRATKCNLQSIYTN